MPEITTTLDPDEYVRLERLAAAHGHTVAEMAKSILTPALVADGPDEVLVAVPIPLRDYELLTEIAGADEDEPERFASLVRGVAVDGLAKLRSNHRKHT